MRYEKWTAGEEHVCDGEYNLNKSVAEKYAFKSDFNELAKNYSHIGPAEIIDIFLRIKNKKDLFNGKGLDLGGGPGIVASSIVDHFGCQMNFVEIVEEIVELGYPIVLDYFGAAIGQSVTPIIGSFDDVKRPDGFYDFCLSWDALHHSRDPSLTLSEAFRVTRDQGYFILVDRVHNNSFAKAELEAMLDVKYPKDFLIKNNIDINTTFTRRENGEHEYRFADWKMFFKNAGWSIKEYFLVLEKHERNRNYVNDFDASHEYVNFEIGGFERRKLVLIAQKN